MYLKASSTKEIQEHLHVLAKLSIALTYIAVILITCFFFFFFNFVPVINPLVDLELEVTWCSEVFLLFYFF